MKKIHFEEVPVLLNKEAYGYPKTELPVISSKDTQYSKQDYRLITFLFFNPIDVLFAWALTDMPPTLSQPAKYLDVLYCDWMAH